MADKKNKPGTVKDKKARTIYFPDAILKGIEEAKKKNKTGENKNQLIINMLKHALRDMYSIDIDKFD
jgi:hypothetical protein